MEAVTNIKYVRISPKKITQIGRFSVGLTPAVAIDKLAFMGGKAAKLLSAAIAQAQANAVNNLKLEKDALKIKTVIIGKGPFFKRWQPVSKGMAHQIKKRTSHIKVVLAEVKTAKVKPKKDKNGTKSKS